MVVRFRLQEEKGPGVFLMLKYIRMPRIQRVDVGGEVYRKNSKRKKVSYYFLYRNLIYHVSKKKWGQPLFFLI